MWGLAPSPPRPGGPRVGSRPAVPCIVPPELVESVVRVMLGSIDVGDGGTDEQRRLIRALVVGDWGRTDLDLDALEPASAEEAAELVVEPAHRRRLRQFMVMVEMCRHPLVEAQVDRTEAYAAALHESGPGLEMLRVFVREGQEAASAYQMTRALDIQRADTVDATVRSLPAENDAEDPELVARLRALGDLPEGTLGREYYDFLLDNGFTFPGETRASPR